MLVYLLSYLNYINSLLNHLKDAYHADSFQI